MHARFFRTVILFSLLAAFAVFCSSAPLAGQAAGEKAPEKKAAGKEAVKKADEEKAAPEPALPGKWLDLFHWRCIGPAAMGGRITAIAVSPKDPSIWWAATASGGLLKTTDNGTTFTHQFDHERTVSIGDVAVAPSDPSILWVGTGEANPRNSVSWGDGVYKSTDGGKTWKHMGLDGTFQTGRIAIHPKNPDIVYVGALGRLWGPNEERGLYKTTDGGKTWKKILYVDDKTGVVDVQLEPGNPDTILVATWERGRDGYDSNSPKKKWGPGSGVYRSTDGGRTFAKVTNGLPTCNLGRIDLEYFEGDPKIVFAVVESERVGQEPENAPYMGIRGEDVEVGARLTEVVEGGPAAKAGLKTGDIVISVEGRTVHSYDELIKEIHRYLAGDTVKVEVSRDRKSVFFEVTFSKKPGAEEDQAGPPPKGGGKGPAAAEKKAEKKTEKKAGKKAGKAGSGKEAAGGEKKTPPAKAAQEVAAQKEAGGETGAAKKPEAEKTAPAGKISSSGKEPKAETKTKTETKKSRTRTSSIFSSGLGGQKENIQDEQGPEGFEFGGVYKSTDGGVTWRRVNSLNPRPMYFSQVRVDPSDASRVYVLGISLYRSKDGGAVFKGDGGRGVHPDHHALWIDPRDGRHMILGTDGGIYVTYDRMDHWVHLNQAAIGQFYHVAVDSRPDYKVYGGLQDNGSWGGPARSRHGEGPANADWFTVGGGDGFVCRVDPNDPDQVFYESQFGSQGSINLRTGERGFIRPRAPRGTRYRFNWKTPFILSHHNPGIFYSAGNYVFRSLFRGKGIKAISPEITNTDKGTATALAESPFDPDVLYVGTDDGALWRTLNGGHDWDDLFEIAPEGKKKEPSRKPGAAIAAERRGRESGRRPGGAGAGGARRPGVPGSGGSRRFGGGAGERAGERGFAAGSGRGGGFRERMLERLKSLDADGDGMIEMGEIPERMAPMVNRLDANGDGAVSKEELEALAGRMGQNPPPAKSAGGTGGTGEPPVRGGKGARPEEAVPGAPRTGAAIEADEVLPEKGEKAPSAATDPLSGTWEGEAVGENIPRRGGGFSLTLKLAPGGKKVTGTMNSAMTDGEIKEGRFDEKTKKFRLAIETDQMPLTVEGSLAGGKMTGRVTVGEGYFSFDFAAARSGAAKTGPSRPKGSGKYEWKRIDELIPGPRWVSSIEPSRFEKGRVYMTLDGHRSDDDSPYVFVSEDRGATWRSLAGTLPPDAGSTRVIREDRENKDVLYLGTEFGAWVSIDGGLTWTPFNGNGNLPTVAVHEFAQHPASGEIVAATHGRSLWLLDVTCLRQMSPETVAAGVHLYKPNKVVYWRREPRRGHGGIDFTGENPKTEAGIFYSLGQKERSVALKITTQRGELVRELEADGEAGLHRVAWDLRRKPPEGRRGRYRRYGGRRVDPGTYLVVLAVGNETLTEELVVENDPEHPDRNLWGSEESDSGL